MRESLSAEEILERKLRRLFPTGFALRRATRILERYAPADGRDPLRVRLDALKLSGGDLAKLAAWIDTAQQDFRDVVAAAEYPAEMAAPPNMDPREREVLQARDREQFEEWLRDA